MAKLPNKGELWAPTEQELIESAISDYQYLVENNGYEAETSYEGTDVWFQYKAMAGMMTPLYYSISVKSDASSELTARGQDLERLRVAAGLPEIPSSSSSGYVTVTVLGGGARTFRDGDEGKLPNGKFVVVDGVQRGIRDGYSVRVKSRETGADTNVPAGTVVKWVSPLFNVGSEAIVTAPGLQGGADAEDDEGKRQRILSRRRNRPGSGNWAHCNEVAEETDGAIQVAFTYPCLGGPSSAKVVLVKAHEPLTHNYSREVPPAKVQKVDAALQGTMPPEDLSTQSAADEYVDVSISLNFSAQNVGWENTTPFPVPNPADGYDGYVTVGSVNTPQQITINKSETNGVAPVEGSSQISWWAPNDLVFVSSLVTTVADYDGYWLMSLQTPLSSTNDSVSEGDFISPTAANAESYRNSIIQEFNSLGPGENTMSSQVLNQNPSRAYRRPFPYERYPYALSSKQLNALQSANPEILDADYLFRSLIQPTVPGSITSPPNILVLRRFGMYPATS